VTRLRDLVDADDLEPGEEARLGRAHEVVLRAEPPQELTPGLRGGPPQPAALQVVEFPLLARRRVAVTFLAAAAALAAAFGGGFLLGNSKSRPASFASQTLVLMHAVAPTANAGIAARIIVAGADAVGNRPLEVSVTGLPGQPPGGYYELWLTRGGRPYLPCGAFRVHGEATTVRFTVPYSLDRYAGWVLTAVAPGGSEPGTIVMTT
jgi:hypothetical protein